MLRNARRLFTVPRKSHRPVVVFALVVFFWTLADASGQYIIPLLLDERGFSNTVIGFIIGTSSIAGALFDVFATMFFKNTNFRRLLLVTFALCAAYPLILMNANTVWLFIFAMAVWGVYFDLYNISTFDFIGRYADKAAHTSGFGMIQTFRSLGMLIAPLVIGVIVVGHVGWQAFALYWLYLAIGLMFFLLLLSLTRGSDPREAHPSRKTIFQRMHVWRKVFAHLLPAFLLTLYLLLVEAFFWTLAPLYAEELGLSKFGGLLLAAYTLPILLVVWFLGGLTRQFGKMRVAYISMLVGACILSLFALASNATALIVLVFAASLFISISLPAINAAYADYISSTSVVSTEIETMEDMAMNTAYVVGPMAGGFLADVVGMGGAFSILGVTGVLLALMLLTTSAPKLRIRT